MPRALAKLNKAGKPPLIEVKFGDLLVGAYKMALWTPDSDDAHAIGKGQNTDNLPDKFPVGRKAENLDGAWISVIASMQNPNPPSSKPIFDGGYTVIVSIFQDGKKVDGAVDPSIPGTSDTVDYQNGDFLFQGALVEGGAEIYEDIDITIA